MLRPLAPDTWACSHPDETMATHDREKACSGIVAAAAERRTDLITSLCTQVIPAERTEGATAFSNPVRGSTHRIPLSHRGAITVLGRHTCSRVMSRILALFALHESGDRCRPICTANEERRSLRHCAFYQVVDTPHHHNTNATHQRCGGTRRLAPRQQRSVHLPGGASMSTSTRQATATTWIVPLPHRQRKAGVRPPHQDLPWLACRAVQ